LKKVPKEKAFYFFTSTSNYAGENASSLEEFLEKVKEIEDKSLEFHLYRGDFEKWIREVWEFEELAEKISEIKNLNLKGESLRGQIYDLVSNFLEVLKEQAPSPVREEVGKVENEANLLVTFDRANRFAAQYEVKQVLKEVGGGKSTVYILEGTGPIQDSYQNGTQGSRQKIGCIM